MGERGRTNNVAGLEVAKGGAVDNNVAGSEQAWREDGCWIVSRQENQGAAAGALGEPVASGSCLRMAVSCSSVMPSRLSSPNVVCMNLVLRKRERESGKRFKLRVWEQEQGGRIEADLERAAGDGLAAADELEGALDAVEREVV